MDITIIPQLIQTIVYCQVMMTGYCVLQQSDMMPTNKLSMAYWYAGDANPFVNHQYTDAQAKEDHTYLSNLIQNINTCKQTGFVKTEQLDHCAGCHYRSYCRQNIPQIPANEYIDIDQLYEDTKQPYEDTGDEWM
jgi:hypothetical protein